jgi:23S rRNA (guanosine2251-2'-O)-methyltransferase
MAGKKGPSKGTGGHGRRALEGKGPTPPARERAKHPAARRTRSAAKRTDASQATRQPRRRGAPPEDLVAGRNAVVEALRASVPARTLYVAVGLDADDRLTESKKLAAAGGIAFLDVTRYELDKITGGAPHQGIVTCCGGCGRRPSRR